MCYIPRGGENGSSFYFITIWFLTNENSDFLVLFTITIHLSSFIYCYIFSFVSYVYYFTKCFILQIRTL